MSNEIKKEYYNFKELSWLFSLSLAWLADLCKMYEIPYKGTSNHYNRVSVQDLWKIYKITELRRQGYGHKIIPAFLNITPNERDRITTYCTVVLGQSRSGNGKKVKELPEMAVSERETKNPVSQT